MGQRELVGEYERSVRMNKIVAYHLHVVRQVNVERVLDDICN